MKLLRNFDIYNLFFDLESRKEFEILDMTIGITGWYKLLDSGMSALYVQEFELYFLFREKSFLIKEEHRVGLRKISENSVEFSITENQKTLVSFIYSALESESSPTPFEYLDDLESDWGVFIQEIINNPVRKQNFILNLMG
ncbi:hypothetical protein ACR78Z_05190 [Sphingobacterium thalpophilum]|uniref:Uncharacterized protein n=1 Tax=Sphingobacterium thalpophilum TaxID=259 RepID=A0A4V6Z335_9SPHI|nr:hypothetical protein [Sphingobacterium thalpophilum]VTR52828.1 Uncharacterised protein [Sphingobacterium thalpophilum]